ncbi:NAD(P)H-binding protein [Streptomyces sp. NEAU-W12]|uniref:NmrA family NAD(P)-binding protein n=1 Tax=Streptomyces sp. NEAU-W12 TaxID=2994668 RepID=UPI00224A5584|nr:NAD(P)H-binding protein [Streptomyces sp. NEAU-W12]MCX2925107.1 NAD(P)H-binding protein [Streptomyces sp. NEAU-W12]
MSENIPLVLGATGETGRRSAARLRWGGAQVRAVSRSSRVRFDWSEPDTWHAVLQDAAVACVVAPSDPNPAHRFVAQAASAGVQRMVLLSGRGVDGWDHSSFGPDMRSAEGAVRSSSVGWTILRASNSAQNFDEDLFHAPLVAGELALPAGAVPEPFIDAEDVAGAAVAVLTEPARHTGRIYELTGSRAVTFAEAVELFSRASGRQLTYRQVSGDEYVSTLVKQGFDRREAGQIAELFVLMESGLTAETTEDLAAVPGEKPRTFEDYVVRAGRQQERGTSGARPADPPPVSVTPPRAQASTSP